MSHRRHEPLESLDLADDRERWAEMEARQFELNAEYLRDECLPGWLDKLKGSWHPDIAKQIFEICLKMQNYEAMADQLRRPRYIRQEQDSYRAAGLIP